MMFTMMQAIAWLLYFALHSLLAADGVKRYAERTIPAVYSRYRLWYSLFAFAGLLVLLVWTLVRPGRQLFAPWYGGALLVALGAWITMAAFKNYNIREFFGLSKAPVVRHAALQTTGLHAWVRHPLYSGALCLFPGVALCLPYAAYWAGVLALLVYLPVGIYLEEQKLVKQFGEGYVTYRKRVKALIPGVW